MVRLSEYERKKAVKLIKEAIRTLKGLTSLTVSDRDAVISAKIKLDYALTYLKPD